MSSSEVDRLLDGLEAPPLVGQVERLEDERERSVVAADALDGRLEVKEAALLKATTTLERFVPTCHGCFI